MNLSFNALFKHDISALDGDIGFVNDMIFNDQTWRVCYVSVDTKRWVPLSKKILLNVDNLQNLEFSKDNIQAKVIQQQVLDSDDVEIQEPLRSVNEVKRYNLVETDGMQGKVHDFIIDGQTWAIKYLVVGTRNWLPGGHEKLLPPSCLEGVSWKNQAVFCGLNVKQLQKIPDFEIERLNDAAYLAQLEDAISAN